MVRYLQSSDKIQEGDLFLNLRGEWELADNVGQFVCEDFGRYLRIEGSLTEIKEGFVALLPTSMLEKAYG